MDMPAITRFAMETVKEETVQKAIRCTGIYPLDRSQIAKELLVGDNLTKTMSNTHPAPVPVPYSSVPQHTLDMRVYNDDGTEADDPPQSTSDKCTQSSPIKSLPCPICQERDVAVHPAVTETQG